MWEDDETTDVMSTVEVFHILNGTIPENEDDYPIIEIIETGTPMWRLEASMGIYLECPYRDVVVSEMMELVGRGYKADLYDPNGKWVATSEGVKRP